MSRKKWRPIDEVKVKPGKQADGTYVPRVPTDGWMCSELERLGVNARGRPFTSVQLVAMLRARGYDVYTTEKEVPDIDR